MILSCYSNHGAELRGSMRLFYDAEHCDTVSSTAALYSGCPRFRSCL